VHALNVILKLHGDEVMSMNIFLTCFLASKLIWLVALSLMLLNQILQTELFKGLLVLVLGLIKILHIHGCYVDVIDRLISVTGHHTNPWKVGLVNKHVLPGANLIDIVSGITVRVADLNLK
jgi:predicted anti-sigma-YlaC factor YlaD